MQSLLHERESHTGRWRGKSLHALQWRQSHTGIMLSKLLRVPPDAVLPETDHWALAGNQNPVRCLLRQHYWTSVCVKESAALHRCYILNAEHSMYVKCIKKLILDQSIKKLF